jgi:hypothetical protein
VNSSLVLASEFIERAANPAFGLEVNEEYALRWAILRQTGDPVSDLQIGELTPHDLDALSLDAWFWLGSTLTDGDPELPAAVIDHLFQLTADPVHRLKVADMSLRHPRLSERYSVSSRSFSELPPTWARDRLLDLLSREDAEGDGLVEMTAILLQIANKPSLRLLGTLRHTRRMVVDGTIEQLAAPEISVAAVVRRLGLEEY